MVHAMSHISTSSLAFPLKAELEWRSNYKAELSQDWWSSSISVTEKQPWYSAFGIYSHYHTQVVNGATVRCIPRCFSNSNLLLNCYCIYDSPTTTLPHRLDSGSSQTSCLVSAWSGYKSFTPVEQRRSPSLVIIWIIMIRNNNQFWGSPLFPSN